MKAVIVHGTLGAPEGNWFPWLQSELIKKGWDVSVPSFPTPQNQTIGCWQEALEAQIPDYRRVDVFIGHSLGATFILRALEREMINPTKVILVSGVIDEINIPDYDVLNAPFINTPFDWKKIEKGSQKFSVLHGDNDPYVPVAQAEKIAENLKVEVRLIENGGHLNAEEGYTEFPELLGYFDA